MPASCSRRVVRGSVDLAIYRQRNLIERLFCKLKQFHRVASRFDKLARNFVATVLIVSTRLWLRGYESTPSPAIASTKGPIKWNDRSSGARSDSYQASRKRLRTPARQWNRLHDAE